MPGTLETRVRPQCQKTKEPEKAHEVRQRLRDWGTHCALNLILALRSPQYLGLSPSLQSPRTGHLGNVSSVRREETSVQVFYVRDQGKGVPPVRTLHLPAKPLL